MALSRGTRSRSLPVERLGAYSIEGFAGDVVAGVTLAAYAIPVSMAYASLAGVAPQQGIYCYLLGGLAYAVLGSSRQLAVGPTSAIAMVVGTTVAGLAEGDASRRAAIAALTALVVALLSAIAWALRLDELTSFVSETILVGFKAGAALTVALTQLPKLFGVESSGEHFFERLWSLATHLPETNPVVLGFGLAALTLLLAGEKLLPQRPVALGVVAIAIVVTSLVPMRDFGVTMVGELPQGLPRIRPPAFGLNDADGILPLACACFLLSYIESISAARTLAARHGDSVDPRRELLGLGAANFAVAFGQGFPVAGGLSQSAVNDKAGARSRVALVIASIALGVSLLSLTGLLRNLPNVILAAVVLVAVRGLVDPAALKRLRQVSRVEFRVAMVALVGVLLLGILKGVMLAAIVSLLMLIAAAARPRVAFLGRIPGTQRFSDLERHPENAPVPHVLLFRVESSILYFNSDHVRKRLWQQVEATPDLRLVIGDLSNTPRVDIAGAQMLSAIQKDLESRGVQLRLAEAHARVRDLLRADGLERKVGYFGRCVSIVELVDQFEQARRLTVEEAAECDASAIDVGRVAESTMGEGDSTT